MANFSNAIVDSINKIASSKKLASWKTNYLSRAGKLVLINSTLNSIPAYYLQNQTLPVTSTEELDKICNDFLWGEKDAKKKIHLVGKTATFLPKDLGGLGIRAHKDLSIIYMARLGWKMSQGPPNLAQDCIRSKYIQNDKVTTFKNGSKTWKNIGVGWDLLQQNKFWQIGDGKDISFWDDNWLGIGSIRSLIYGPLNRGDHFGPARFWAGFWAEFFGPPRSGRFLFLFLGGLWAS